MIVRARVWFSQRAIALAVLWLAACQKTPPSEQQHTAPTPSNPAPVQSANSSAPAAKSDAPLHALPTPTAPGRAHPVAGELVVIQVQESDSVHAEAAGRIERMKPGLVACRGLAQKSQLPLRGRIRLRLSVAPSGGVSGVDLPEWDPTNPSFDPDSSGSPRPNPDNVNLERLVVPCLKAQLQQARFAAADTSWTLVVNVRIQ